MTDSRFPEPEPDDWEPPSLKELYTPRPLDTNLTSRNSTLWIFRRT
jgi:hypothetical protein